MSSSRPDTVATNLVVDSWGNRRNFAYAREATIYDNLLLDGSISNADIRYDDGWSGLHLIPYVGQEYRHLDVDTDILLSYLLTCDSPADVNGRTSRGGYTPMWEAARSCSTSLMKVLIDFGGDRTIKNNSDAFPPNMTPLDLAKLYNIQEIVNLLMEYFPSEE